jgi:glycerophosphoryl diester phosphodiesterase
MPLRHAAGLVRLAWTDVRRAWGPLVVFEAAFQLLQAWLLVPAVALALTLVMARSGRVAVSDWDILDFLLTPFGLLYAALLGVGSAALLLFEQAGVMAVVARAARPPSRLPGPVAVLGAVWRVTRLGATQAALLTLTAVPFAGLLWLTYALALSRHDINYYLANRPPAFWVAGAVGGLTAVVAVGVGVRQLVRWAFALPVLLFERRSVRDALRAGRERVRGAEWRVGGVLLGWQAAGLLAGSAVQVGFRLLAAQLPDGAAENAAVLAALLIARGTLLAGVSVAAAVGTAVLARRLYLERSEHLGPLPGAEPAADGGEPLPPRTRRMAALAGGVLVGSPMVVWAGLSLAPADRPPVAITAHRGHERAAPENTASAIRAAIACGADYAEIDVQLTADGHVVLLHDRDLKRVTGDPRRVDQITLAELRTLDAGAWFGPAFVGERVPTLTEVIHLCRGRIKLNVELKYYGPDGGLARAVSRILSDAKFEADCLVTSFDQGALAEVRGANPAVRTAPIISTALGDVTRLDGDALSIRADYLTDEVAWECHRRGREVHVWTVNDERQAVRLILRGADNLITSDPELMVGVRGRWAARTDAERLVLASRALLGLD